MASLKTSPDSLLGRNAPDRERETIRAIAALLPQAVPVTIRVSGRVRGVSLRFVPDKGLEVVTAPGIPADILVTAVTRRREWLERVCRRLASEGFLPGQLVCPNPHWIVLSAFGREWRVDYAPRVKSGCVLTVRGPQALLVSGDVEDRVAVGTVLAAFCRERADGLLRQALADVSREADLPYAGATVRAQRTRWGSCSAKGHINLNFTLAFLPWELTRLVLLHELCHTKELNHSERFWALLERYIPHCRAVDARLATARYYLPLWLRP